MGVYTDDTTPGDTAYAEELATIDFIGRATRTRDVAIGLVASGAVTALVRRGLIEATPGRGGRVRLTTRGRAALGLAA